jgi:hypothetical protein
MPVKREDELALNFMRYFSTLVRRNGHASAEIEDPRRMQRALFEFSERDQPPH